jgi:C4-dicarboxylate transporter DctM subunit
MRLVESGSDVVESIKTKPGLAVNLVIGQITPPVGVLMFVASSVSKTHLGLIVKEIGPFVLTLIGALALLTYVPQLSTWLPQFLKT